MPGSPLSGARWDQAVYHVFWSYYGLLLTAEKGKEQCADVTHFLYFVAKTTPLMGGSHGCC